MCGIAGFWTQGPHQLSMLQAMTDAIAHRGPDAGTDWHDTDHGIYLGHRRLAIIDLTEAGAQPMTSHCGRYVLTYNGEVYNHLVLREELSKEVPELQWRGSSDTETVLVAISTWGFAKALQRLDGMFAAVVWDREKQCLSVGRDRFGQKPLFYGFMNGTLFFASELKAIMANPNFKLQINQSALAEYILTSSVSAPLCIAEGMHKLEAGHYFQISSPEEPPTPIRYGQAPEEVTDTFPENTDREFILDQLEDAVASSVETNMLSDVSLGAFLSGGYDSSLVVAHMQRASSRPVRTFAIGFEDPAFNEAPFAKDVANHLATEHTEFYVSHDDVLEVVDEIASIWDEPFADPSQIPTYLVSRLTKKEVTVALSGDGGDEFFAGYSRYTKAVDIWQRVNRVPGIARNTMAQTIGRALQSPATLRTLTRILPPTLLTKVAGAAGLLYLAGSKSEHALFQKMMSSGQYSASVLKHKISPTEPHPTRWNNNFIKAMCLEDISNYMPETIFTKVDRAAMAVSLETRAPLIGNAVADLALKIPTTFNVSGGTGGKQLIKELTHRHIPQTLMERPKKGFGIPLADLLRGPLKGLGDRLLERDRLEQQALFDADHVQWLWGSHQAGSFSHHRVLWNIIVFQLWYDKYAA